MASDAISRTPVAVTLVALFVLALGVGGLHGDGHLSDRAAWGALAGLATGAATLVVAFAVVHHRHGGPTSE